MNDMINLLKEFHFTESESKVYISLLENGEGTGYEISKFSGVPNSKVYSILEALMQKGVLTNSLRSKNTIYKAEPIAKVSKLLLERANKSAAQLEKLGSNFSTKEEDDKIWNIEQKDSVISSCVDLIDNAKNEIMIQIWVNDLTSELEQSLINKQNEGINVLVILFDLEEEYKTNIKNYFAHGFEKPKLHDLKSRWINLSVDGEKMIYASFGKKDLMEGITTRNSSMVYFAQEYIKHDAYCLNLINLLKEKHPDEINEYLQGVREIFLK